MPVEHPAAGGIAIGAAQIAARLFLSLVFGALIGIERQWHHKNAGVKTHALVSVGASTFGLVSLLGFGATNNPMLIAGGVVTGIGFIGGGVIMHQGGVIQGINTAATLWATASMGLAVGAGYYFLTTLAFIAVMTIQFPLSWLEESVEKQRARPGESSR